MKRLWIAGAVLVVALVAAAILLSPEPVTASNAATVINWGGGATCGATCGGIPCVVNGKLTAVQTSSGKNSLTCNDADWLFAPPPTAARGLVTCGSFGSGQFVITPSGRVNFYCNNN